jgi:hypothetical protein
MKAIMLNFLLLVIFALARPVSVDVLVYRGAGRATFTGANRVVPLVVRSWELHDTDSGAIHTIGYLSVGGQKYYTSQRTTNEVWNRIFAPPRDRVVLTSTVPTSSSNLVNMEFYKGFLYDLDIGNGRRAIAPRTLTGLSRGLVAFGSTGPVLYEGSDTLVWSRPETVKAFSLGDMDAIAAYYVQWLEQRGYSPSP